MNPSNTLFAGLGVSQVADIITWLSTWPVTAPPQNVALALAALAVAAGHLAANIISARWKLGQPPAPPAAPPVAPPAQP